MTKRSRATPVRPYSTHPQTELSVSSRILQIDLRPLARALIDLAIQMLKEEQELQEERKAA